jgi:hypothetical protein
MTQSSDTQSFVTRASNSGHKARTLALKRQSTTRSCASAGHPLSMLHGCPLDSITECLGEF